MLTAALPSKKAGPQITLDDLGSVPPSGSTPTCLPIVSTRKLGPSVDLAARLSTSQNWHGRGFPSLDKRDYQSIL
jgi:hypothetical protein